MKQIISVFVLSVTLVLSGCGEASTGSSSQTRYVITVTPAECSGTVSRQLSGKVKSEGIVKLGFKIGGEIEKINVREGAKVRKGQLLAKIDDSSYLIGRDAALAQYEQLKGEVGRIRKLYAGKAVSKNDYEKAEAGLKRAEAGLKGEQMKVDYTALYAPADGEILSVLPHEHEVTNAGMPVFTMIENGSLQVEIELPASLYDRIGNVRDIRCVCGGVTAPMVLRSVSPKADNNQLHSAIMSFSGQCPSSVNPGNNVVVSLDFPSDGGNSLSIPSKALFEDGGAVYVWTVDSLNVIRRKAVVPGEMLQDGNIVVGGLLPSDKVVRAGVHHLSEGEKVEIISTGKDE